MRVRAKIYKLLLRLLRKRIGKERPDEGVLITQRLRELLQEAGSQSPQLTVQDGLSEGNKGPTIRERCAFSPGCSGRIRSKQFVNRRNKSARLCFLDHSTDSMFLGFRPYLRPINCVQHGLYSWQDLADLFSCSQSVPFGPCEIQDYQVGFQLHSFPDRLTPVYCVAAHFPTRMRFEHRTDAAQHLLVVISYEDAFCHGGSSVLPECMVDGKSERF